MARASSAPEPHGDLLVKVRAGTRPRALAAQGVDVEPLYPGSSSVGTRLGAAASSTEWLLLRSEPDESPWDQAHGRVADRLGLPAEAVLFVEPDLVHTVHHDERSSRTVQEGFAVGANCTADPQNGTKGRATGDGFAWHLGEGHSQLARARDEVAFSSPRTRIAHLDTGYSPSHETVPQRLSMELERNFVRLDANPDSAVDPDHQFLLIDNSGHGTGTLSILAGGGVSAQQGTVMGGAPQAEIVPLRVADSVVLLRTSAFARALRYASEIGCQVASMSMGGLPTRAWAEAVDQAYLDGLCLCSAAGNRLGPSPPKHLVYPARYPRVIGVTGAMANGKPYDDLDGLTMQGSFGPRSVMRWAMAAYTPNIPWAKFGCDETVDLDGNGTSSATPQVAAAAALWIEKYKSQLPADWRRVEAVRFALFSTAKTRQRERFFGHGILQAHKALAVQPRLNLEMSPPSKNSWAFLRLLTGLGLTGPTPREEMYNLELAQRWLLNDELQQLVPDPDDPRTVLEGQKLRDFMDALIADKGASSALRRQIADRYANVSGGSTPKPTPALEELRGRLPPVAVDDPEIPTPARRRLRVYAKDPTLSARLATRDISEVTLEVPWEETSRGPVGEYVEVVDQERSLRRKAGRGASGGHNYRGIDLHDERLLAQDGWAPSEGNPQFHQQMVYAVAMKTIEHFERALGRPVLWRPRPDGDRPYYDGDYVGRLVIRPHALEQANAYYTPQEVALLFGVFAAPEGSGVRPGSPVYTCLSHDIIAHETSHAVLDGMHRRYNEPTNPDVLAFHEGFADLVALLQQFTITELLEHEIAKTRGDLSAESLLGELALQLGHTTSGRGALRSAIGSIDEDGRWHRHQPQPNRLRELTTPHERGGVLVAAVFDALLAIYDRRVADLLRLAGDKVSHRGDLHPDLVRRLAREASKAANHVLTMCIRALDFLPPVDVTFHDFLRALITADFEMVHDDALDYRVAFVEAFRRHEIYPGDHDEQAELGQALSVDTLRWPAFDAGSLRQRDQQARQAGADRKAMRRAEIEGAMEQYRAIVARLKEFADGCLYITNREELFRAARRERAKLRGIIGDALEKAPALRATLGLEEGGFEVHALRHATRQRPDGTAAPQVIMSLTQSRTVEADDRLDTPEFPFRGGSTIVVDLRQPELPKYVVVKDVLHARRRAAGARFAREVHADPLRRMLFSANEPFAVLHQFC